ncbi:8-amino-7-oxononanoate synthase [uncultured Oxalicibacterium sp.]|uniref:8-amino-7-oxononanoate synthase n=1 Tax=uncultured Oxalicibacterium sp. TaxID=1168540 RepID=UPI0025F34ACD|nr:8-amino-7-oxononanoate synthase [uncultured Oxalicibacterium sp.]
MSSKLIADLEQRIADLDAQSLRRRLRVAESPCAPHMQVDGKPLLAFCSNDYLGLATHPRIVSALQEGAALYGVGSGASHLINGHSRAHALLEERLAAFLSPYVPQARALTFSTGYMANLAILSAFGGSDVALFSEELNHASLIDGARLSRAQVQIYAHGDTAQLAVLLAASTAARKLVVTDSVFSMDGDLAPLKDLLALCEQHDAWLVVDDAHGFGVLGEHGRGVLEHLDLCSPQLIYMGTLGKAAGVGGAFVAAHATAIEWMVQRARPYIYTTASPPAIAHAVQASLDIIEGREGAARRVHLCGLIAAWQDKMQLQRWQRMASQTAIQPVLIGDNAEAMRAATALYKRGFWVPAIRPPTVPAGTARLRVTLSAAHDMADLGQLVAVLQQLEGEHA